MAPSGQLVSEGQRGYDDEKPAERTTDRPPLSLTLLYSGRRSSFRRLLLFILSLSQHELHSLASFERGRIDFWAGRWSEPLRWNGRRDRVATGIHMPQPSEWQIWTRILL